jgi:hypothetical protein
MSARFVHVINPAKVPPSSSLYLAQPVTFESIRVAKEFAAAQGVDVDLCAVNFPEDDEIVPEFFSRRKHLTRSVLDCGRFVTPRKLPLLADILEAGRSTSDAEFMIYTNADIAMVPHFYVTLDRLVQSGFDAFMVTRRTLSSEYKSPAELWRMYADLGETHPGDDCFICRRELSAQYELGEACIGIKYVARLFAFNLILHSERFEHFTNLHLTFHIGDDRIWDDDRWIDYSEHNARFFRAVARAHRDDPRTAKHHLLKKWVTRFGQDQQPAAKPKKWWKRFGASTFPDLASRRLIFSINSGRSGSKYLAELLGTAEHVKSFHEAEPKMSGEYMAMINEQPLEATTAKRRTKSEAIAAVLREMGPKDIYVETNHTFIKSFYDVVLEDFRNVQVIILRRDLALVLKSFIELGYFSPLNPRGHQWMSSPNAVTAAVAALAPDDQLDQFDRCIAYLIDIEARAERFKKEYPHVPTHEVDLTQLNDFSFVRQLFRRLELNATRKTKRICGQIVNDKQKRKGRIPNPTTLEECRRRLADYVLRAKERGIQLPSTIEPLV